jgi:hypothetical protein
MFWIKFFSGSTLRILVLYFQIRNQKKREKANENLILKSELMMMVGNIILKKKVNFFELFINQRLKCSSKTDR